VVGLGVAAFAVGVVVASLVGSDEPAVQPSSSPSTSGASVTATASASASQSETAAPTTSASPSEPVDPSSSPLPDDRYFVKPSATVAGEDDSPELSFEVAEFLTGAEATAAAEAAGESAASGYYIVNEDTQPDRLPFAQDVRVKYFPIGSCCDPVKGDLDAWIRGLHGAENSYAGSSSWWWITVRDGRIVAIEEQYLP
jgi:hypothetical protein